MKLIALEKSKLSNVSRSSKDKRFGEVFHGLVESFFDTFKSFNNMFHVFEVIVVMFVIMIMDNDRPNYDQRNNNNADSYYR